MLIAAVFAALIFWVIKPSTPPTYINNQEPQAVKAAQVDKATVKLPETERAQAKSETVEPVGEVLDEQKSDTQKVDISINDVPTTLEPGSKEEMMAAAGIPTSDWAAVDYIVSKESTWRPGVINPSSGSCGLVQELPCGKSGCTLGDGVCQLRWASQYATSRYGSWWGAHAFWQSNRWW